MLLSQVTDVANTASQVLAGRSDAMILLVIIFGIIGLWIWKVVIPERQKSSEIKASQAETLKQLATVSCGTANDAYNARKNTETLIASKGVLVQCLEKVNDRFQCGLDSDLAEARGMLKLAQFQRAEEPDQKK